MRTAEPNLRVAADAGVGVSAPGKSRWWFEILHPPVAAAGRRQRHTVRSPAVEPPLVRLKAGTMLVREWHRTTHRVTVEEQGFLFRGERYRSLSEIARTITGTRWSGPLFFGLKSKEQSDVTAIRLVGGAPQQTSGTEGSNALPSATHPRVSEILRCHGRKGRVHGDCDCAQLSLSRRKNDRMDVDPSRRRHLRAGTIKISPQGGLAS